MDKTLVLVVDRDDDFGVKAGVQSPVIGVHNCMEVASDFGIADPEDSDLNALYAAISVCLELKEDGKEVEVALICGDPKVGHRSDIKLSEQFEDVLKQVGPSSVVLVGDGAEDEFIYPIISSRVRVDSVRKVFVKQAPSIEGSLYIVTRMLSDPGKRKRFLAPIGLTLMILAMFYILPSLLLYHKEGDFGVITSMSGSLALFTVGLIVTLYGFNVVSKIGTITKNVEGAVKQNSSKFIFMCLSVSVVLLGAVWSYISLQQMYIVGTFSSVLYFLLCMVWPVAMAFYFNVIGSMILKFQVDKVFQLSNIVICFNVTSIAFVVMGILDLALNFIGNVSFGDNAIMEIIIGVGLTIFINFLKSRMNRSVVKDAEL